MGLHVPRDLADHAEKLPHGSEPLFEIVLALCELCFVGREGRLESLGARFLERDEAERAVPIEPYPWDGVENLRLLTQLQSSVVVGVY